MLERERDQVAAACRRLAAEGLVIGTAGNVSARADRARRDQPTGAVLADADAGAGDDRRTSTASVVDGELAPTSELDLHLGVYRRYGAGAVVHTHAPMATALSCVLDELPCVHYQMLLLGGAVPGGALRAPSARPSWPSRSLDALEGRTAALMANHGAIAHAADPDAGGRARRCCSSGRARVYWRAAAIGTPRALDERAGRRSSTRPLDRGYGTTKPVQTTGAAREDR